MERRVRVTCAASGVVCLPSRVLTHQKIAVPHYPISIHSPWSVIGDDFIDVGNISGDGAAGVEEFYINVTK